MATRHARTNGEREHIYYTTTHPHPHAGVFASGMRPRTSSAVLRGRETRGDQPWQHMTQTYTWVIEQELQTVERRNRKTEQWIMAQQIYVGTDDRRRATPIMEGPGMERHVWEEVIHEYERDATRWMKEEEEARRKAVERERARQRERERIIQEEVRKVEERVRQKRDDERHRIMEERTKRYMELRDRERREIRREEKMLSDAWARYETGWEKINGGTEELEFGDIPWPLVTSPGTTDEITVKKVERFLFWAVDNDKRKERIRSGQLRWHPDRFRRLLGRVKEGDKKAVEEGAGMIARYLNELMSKEKQRKTH